MESELVYGVSDFVAYLNQTLEIAYPFVTIEGEIANFRISKNKWVYFDLKDDFAKVSCFASIYQMPGPLENGILVKVSGSPRLHPLYNFSFTVQSIVPVGEGSIKRAADLLQAKLTAEGLFDAERKRSIPYPPHRIGLITASQSAAYADFIKIANARWRGLDIMLVDVLVQGEQSPDQLVNAIEKLNNLAQLPDVIVMIRGGGSVDDLQAFSNERVVRAVAASRIPTLVAIGHEVDVSLAELAADQRASTPSNAAELLLPDRNYVSRTLDESKAQLKRSVLQLVAAKYKQISVMRDTMQLTIDRILSSTASSLKAKQRLLMAYNPELPLDRGYALIRDFNGGIVRHIKQARLGEMLNISVMDGTIEAKITSTVQKGKQ